MGLKNGAKKVFYGLYFGKTCYKDLVFLRNDFLRLVRDPNESLILIIINYMFKYSVGTKKNYARVTSEPKNILNSYILAKLVIRNQILREMTF